MVNKFTKKPTEIAVEAFKITLGGAFLEGSKKFVQYLIEMTNATTDFLTSFGVVDSIKTLFTAFVEGAIASLKILQGYFAPLTNAIKAFAEKSKILAGVWGNELKQAMIALITNNNVAAFFLNLSESLKTLMNSFLNFITDSKKVGEAFTILWAVIKQGSSIASTVLGGFATLTKGVIGYVGQYVKITKEGFSFDWGSLIRRTLIDTTNFILNQGVDMTFKALDGVLEAFKKVGGEIFPTLKTALNNNDWATVFEEVSKKILQGLVVLQNQFFKSIDLISAELGKKITVMWETIGKVLIDSITTALNMAWDTVSQHPIFKIFDKLMEKITGTQPINALGHKLIGSTGGALRDLEGKSFAMVRNSLDQFANSIRGNSLAPSNNAPAVNAPTLPPTITPNPTLITTTPENNYIPPAPTTSYSSSVASYEADLQKRRAEYKRLLAETKDVEGWGEKVGSAYNKGLTTGLSETSEVEGALGYSADYLEGSSPTRKGPFSKIDKWGYNVGLAYIGGLAKGLTGAPLFSETQALTGTTNQPINGRATSIKNSTNTVINVNIKGDNTGNRMDGKLVGREVYSELQRRGVLSAR
jgi:hypothetical protein